jgi:hypothetical protein
METDLPLNNVGAVRTIKPIQGWSEDHGAKPLTTFILEHAVCNCVIVFTIQDSTAPQ